MLNQGGSTSALGHAALALCLPDLKLMEGRRHVQTQFLMTEGAGTAQGVDVVLLLCGGGHGNIGNIFCRTGLQNMLARFASVGLVLAHVVRFWATLQNVWLCRPHLGPCWAKLGQGWDHFALILNHSGPKCTGLMLSHFGLLLGICWPLCWTWAFECCLVLISSSHSPKKKTL